MKYMFLLYTTGKQLQTPKVFSSKNI